MIPLKELHTCSIEYGPPKQNVNGSQYVNCNNDELIVQLPPCSFVSIDVHKTECILKVCVSNPHLIKFINKLEHDIIPVAYGQSVSWFKKQLVSTKLREIFSSCLSDGNILSLYIPLDDHGNYLIKCFDVNKKEQSLAQHSLYRYNLEIITQLQGLFFVSKSFGFRWKVLQMKLHFPKLHEYAFIDDNDSDTDE
jgi:hypothetical protein